MSRQRPVLYDGNAAEAIPFDFIDPARIGERLLAPNQRHWSQIVREHRKTGILQIRTLEGAARALVFGIPSVYARYRRSCFEQRKWFRTGIELKARSLAPAEVDVLLLVMLRNAGRAMSMVP